MTATQQMLTDEAIANKIVTSFSADLYQTPYALARDVNKALKALDVKAVDKKTNELVVKQLPPQMIYTYTAPDKQYIKSDDQRRVTKANAIEWLVRYVKKNFADQLVDTTESVDLDE